MSLLPPGLSKPRKPVLELILSQLQSPMSATVGQGWHPHEMLVPLKQDMNAQAEMSGGNEAEGDWTQLIR